MRIVYMGTPEYARRPLVALCENERNVVAVVTGQAKRTGRSKKLIPTAVCEEARKRGLPVFTPASLKDESFHRQIKALEPDLIVVVAFRILPEKLYTIPKLGAINIHASLLPRYRGAAPINWALINGETETGLTSFFLKKAVDTGDIILQEKVAISSSDNFDSLYTRLSEVSGPFLLKTIERIESGDGAPLPQRDEEATPAPKIDAFSAQIDFGFPAEKVRNFVRGLSTVPGACTFFRGKKVKILECRVSDENRSELPPGAVMDDRKRLIIQCARSAVEILTILPEGKKAMTGQSFRNGSKPEPGELFGSISEKVEEN